MSKIDNFLLMTIAKVAKKAASQALNSASVFDFHQPKEPANLKEMLKKESK